jgi:heme O synthase-like polyprenyltransferase
MTIPPALSVSYSGQLFSRPTLRAFFASFSFLFTPQGNQQTINPSTICAVGVWSMVKRCSGIFITDWRDNETDKKMGHGGRAPCPENVKIGESAYLAAGAAGAGAASSFLGAFSFLAFLGAFLAAFLSAFFTSFFSLTSAGAALAAGTGSFAGAAGACANTDVVKRNANPITNTIKRFILNYLLKLI